MFEQLGIVVSCCMAQQKRVAADMHGEAATLLPAESLSQLAAAFLNGCSQFFLMRWTLTAALRHLIAHILQGGGTFLDPQTLLGRLETPLSSLR